MRRVALVGLAVIYSVIFYGCVTANPVVALRADKGRELGTSVIALDVQIVSHSSDFYNWHNDFYPVLTLQKLTTDGNSNFQSEPSDISVFSSSDRNWEISDDTRTIKSRVYALAEPGDYILSNLHFYAGSIGDTSYTKYFYINRRFALEEDTIHVLGELIFEVFGVEGHYSSSKYDYRIGLNQEVDVREMYSDLKSAYPESTVALIEDPKLCPTRYMVLNSHWTGYMEQSLWPTLSTELFEARFALGSRYYVEKKIENKSYSYIKAGRTFFPDNHRVEWTTEIKESAPENEIGLIYGMDSSNYYMFSTSTTGEIAIYHLNQGKWQVPVLSKQQSPALEDILTSNIHYSVSNSAGVVTYTVGGHEIFSFETHHDNISFLALFFYEPARVFVDNFLIEELPR